MELRGFGEIDLLRIRSVGEIAELLGETQRADGVREELGGGVEVRQLYGFGSDGADGLGEIGSDAADGGLEGGDGGAEGGEGDLGVGEGGELGEELRVAGDDVGAELGVEEADGLVETLGGGGGGAGGECGGGEGGGGEGWGEEWGEDGVVGEGV